MHSKYDNLLRDYLFKDNLCTKITKTDDLMKRNFDEDDNKQN